MGIPFLEGDIHKSATDAGGLGRVVKRGLYWCLVLGVWATVGLAGVVGFFCVFEQLSGLIFREAVEVAEEPRAKWALAEIFRDEAFHGAFGFEAAAWFVPRGDEARRARLAERASAPHCPQTVPHAPQLAGS